MPQPSQKNIPQPVEDFLSLAQEAAEEEETLLGLRIARAALTGEDLSGLSLQDVVFEDCRFPGCDWRGASFTGVIFHNCDLSGGNFDRTFWLRCRCEETRALGLRLQNCRLRESAWVQCRLSGANFSGGKLRQVDFSDSALDGSFFHDCLFTGVTFQNCDLSQAGFVHTALKNVDFTTAQIGGLTLSEGFPELRGAVVDLFQAADLARRLGLVIKE